MVKRVIALIGIIVLVAMYGVTLVFALIDDPNTMYMLGASVVASAVIPVLIWAGMMLVRGRNQNKENNAHIDEAFNNAFKDASRYNNPPEDQNNPQD